MRWNSPIGILLEVVVFLIILFVILKLVGAIA